MSGPVCIMYVPSNSGPTRMPGDIQSSVTPQHWAPCRAPGRHWLFTWWIIEVGKRGLKKEKRHEDVQEGRRDAEGHHVCQFLNTNGNDDKDSNNHHPLACFASQVLAELWGCHTLFTLHKKLVECYYPGPAKVEECSQGHSASQHSTPSNQALDSLLLTTLVHSSSWERE